MKSVAAVFVVVLFLFVLSLIGEARAEDCTHGGKYSRSTCYGVQHGAIAAVVVGAMTAADPQLALPVAAGTCGVFLLREAQSDSGAFGSTDDIMDWVTPCVVGGVIAWKWGDHSWLPWVGDGDTAGIVYETRF